MEFHFSEPQTDAERFFGGHYYINAIGAVAPGDDKKFQEFLRVNAPPPRLTVYIDSRGGDVDAAIGIGRQIRENWFSTSIGRYVLSAENQFEYRASREHVAGICASAATLIFLGGRLRYFPAGAKFGVHQFSFRNPSPSNVSESQILSAKIATYVHEMGVSARFLEISAGTPGNEIDEINEERLRGLGVVTGGQTDAEWSIQGRNNMMYVRGERDSLYGHHKVMLCFVKEVGFMFWAVIESQGREEELTRFGLVEIVVNEEDLRMDISQRCVRNVINSYTHVFSPITAEEARSIAFAESFGVQIRFSADAPLFLGISAISTAGGTEQLQTFHNLLAGI